MEEMSPKEMEYMRRGEVAAKAQKEKDNNEANENILMEDADEEDREYYIAPFTD